MHDFNDWLCFKCFSLLPKPTGGLCGRCFQYFVIDLFACLGVIATFVFTLGVIVWALAMWAKWLLG